MSLYAAFAGPSSLIVDAHIIDAVGSVGWGDWFCDWPNIEDHSQIVRFVSSLIAHGFEGIVRAGISMGVVLHADVGVRQQ